jgi:hypothetical protein
MIRVDDYAARGLADHGIRHVFMVTAGAPMHLNERAPGLQLLVNRSSKSLEQASCPRI